MPKGMFNDVMWGKTLQINAIRAFVAGIIVAIFIAVQSSSQSIDNPVFAYLLAPIVFVIFIFPFILLLNGLSHIGVPFIGIVSLLFSWPMFLADPLKFILHRTAPQLIPTEKYNFINFTPLILVTRTYQ